MELFNTNNLENHPWNNNYIFNNSNTLIIGTFPPRRFTVTNNKTRNDFTQQELDSYKEDVFYYYGSKDSKFWTFIEIIFNENISATEKLNFDYCFNDISIKQRIEFCFKFGISFCDIIQTTRRTQDNANDANLNAYTFNEIIDRIKETNITQILLTSSNNSISTKSLFDNYLLNHQITINYKRFETNGIGNYYEGNLNLNGKIILVRTLYSPSRCEYKGVPLRKVLKQYKYFIVGTASETSYNNS